METLADNFIYTLKARFRLGPQFFKLSSLSNNIALLSHKRGLNDLYPLHLVRLARRHQLLLARQQHAGCQRLEDLAVDGHCRDPRQESGYL